MSKAAVAPKKNNTTRKPAKVIQTPWLKLFLLTILIAYVITIISMIILRNYGQSLVFSDTGVYHSYAKFMWQGKIPYRNFQLEYPPGVLPFIWLGGLFDKLVGNYTLSYLFICVAAVTLLFGKFYRLCSKKEFYLAVAVIFFMADSVFFQLDILCAVVLFMSFLLLKQKRLGWSAAMFGIASLIKFYPLVCLPAVLLSLPSKNAAWQYVRIIGLVLIIGFLPFLIASPHGVYAAFGYHTGRPIQIMSGPAAVGFVVSLFGNPLRAYVSNRSMSLGFPSDRIVNELSSCLILIGLVSASWFLIAKKQFNKVATGSVLLLMIFITLFKVGSPGFLLLPISLLPFVNQEIGQRITRKLWALFLAVAVVIFILMFANLSRITVIHWYVGLLVVIRLVLQLAIVVVAALAIPRSPYSKSHPKG